MLVDVYQEFTMSVHGGHHAIESGASCACCFEDLTPHNYVEYLPYPSAVNDNQPLWLPAQYCQDCIQQLLSTQWSTYTEALLKTTCKAEQRRLLTRGPPINLRDDRAMPCPNNEEIHKLWLSSTDEVRSAKLDFSLIGEVGVLDFCGNFDCFILTAMSGFRREIIIGRNRCSFIAWTKPTRTTSKTR
jgi:hypothetical protein